MTSAPDLSPPPAFPVLRYIRAHPFSTMALCNIVGDTSYLGYAFAAHGFVSVPKLIGALMALTAHVLLLAYGDDQARVIAAEMGKISQLLLNLRLRAQRLTALMPPNLSTIIRAHPVGISFSMLAVNGAAFLGDGILRLREGFSISMVDQALMGVFITLGTGSFALADFVKRQGMADWLTKMASTILACASILNVILATTTLNPFIILSVIAFALSNFAAFFTRLDKEKIQQLQN